MASTSTSKLNTSVSGSTNSKENFVKSNNSSVVDSGNSNQNKKHNDNHPELNAHLQNLDNLIGKINACLKKTWPVPF